MPPASTVCTGCWKQVACSIRKQQQACGSTASRFTSRADHRSQPTCWLVVSAKPRSEAFFYLCFPHFGALVACNTKALCNDNEPAFVCAARHLHVCGSLISHSHAMRPDTLTVKIGGKHVEACRAMQQLCTCSMPPSACTALYIVSVISWRPAAWSWRSCSSWQLDRQPDAPGIAASLRLTLGLLAGC